MTVKTIKCTDCDWITDIETTSDTNPRHCPKCGAEYVDAYTGEPIEKNPAAVSLGRLGGRAKSAAKSASSRANGAKGGRPRNVAKTWNAMSTENRLNIIRKCVPDGSWDFYAESTWENLFGGVADRFEGDIRNHVVK